jgi:hypothetical protein
MYQPSKFGITNLFEDRAQLTLLLAVHLNENIDTTLNVNGCALSCCAYCDPNTDVKHDPMFHVVPCAGFQISDPV